MTGQSEGKIAMAFEVGDLVEIKSGGAPMTVETVDDEWVTCMWYIGDKFTRMKFDPRTLRKSATPAAT